MNSLSAIWNRLPAGTRRASLLALTGAVIGLISVGFHYFVDALYKMGIEHFAELSPLRFIFGSLVCVMGASLLASYLIYHFSREAGGGGVMPTKMAFWRDFGVMPFRTAVVKFIASGLTLGGGVSMGPEGPSVQIGAGTASAIATRAGVVKQQHRVFSAAGAAAAIAAAFNAPLAAILFVLEEIIGDLNTRLISGILLAAVTGSLVAHALVGPQPAYQVFDLTDTSWRAIAFCVPVAACATFMGVLFQLGAMRLRARLKGFSAGLPGWATPCIGAFASWIIACAIFLLCGRLGIFGIGYHDITRAINGDLELKAAGLLLLGKVSATIFAVGAGGCGGIFAPAFFIGAMTGAALSSLVSIFIPLTHSDFAMLVMIGMCASLGGVIRAPLTSIILIFEVTHQFSVIPFALLATLVSQLLAKRLQPEGMYEQMLLQDGHNPERVMPPRDYSRWKAMHVGVLTQYKVYSLSHQQTDGLKKALSETRYSRFPLLTPEGRVLGVLSREGIQAAVASSVAPVPLKPKWIKPSDSMEAAQNALIDAPLDILFVGDEENARLEGLLTLHDILRAQQRLSDDGMA